MPRFVLIILSILLLGGVSLAQPGIEVPATIDGADTIPYLFLKEIRIVTKRQFKSKAHERRYNRLYRDVVKVYPYAKKAGELLKELDAEMAGIETRAERKDFLNQKEEALFAEFEDDIRKMTIRQGVILIKLVDREVGENCYHLVKDLRGGFQAFFWQGVARLFGQNLKTDYDPELEHDIEVIVRSLENT